MSGKSGRVFYFVKLRFQYYWRNSVYSQSFTKASIFILMWSFSTGLPYDFVVNPFSFIQLANTTNAIIFIGLSSMLFLLSPLAGYLADVKYNRFNMLVFSTYVTTVSEIFIVITSSTLFFTVHSAEGIYFQFLFNTSFILILVYCCGKVFFLANILQFGIDQLCDAPSMCSVLFLQAYMWFENFSIALGRAINIPGHTIFINEHHKELFIDKTKAICYGIGFAISIVLSILALVLLRHKKTWFFREHIGANPYKLVSNVIAFAMKHKAPVNPRSAFTYCGNEHPSRLDLGKKRFGGPFTTEQVEDVKVFLNILKILFSMSPVFILDLVATISSINNPYQKSFIAKNPIKLMFLDYGLISPLYILFCIPFYQILLRHFISKFTPNFFVRIGLSIAMQTTTLAFFLLFDTLSYTTSYELNNVYHTCQYNGINGTSAIEKSVVHIPTSSMFIIINIMMSTSRMLLYISTWEFICCQSPQHMKGFVFGLFFAIRATFQLVSIVMLFPILYVWKYQVVRCQFIVYLVNVVIGIATLFLYTNFSKKYKYRKRDDICNIYQYAEDYYTKYGST